MQITILYPSDYFDLKKVDETYAYEYREAAKFKEYNIVLYNYDEFIEGEALKLYPSQCKQGLCIYRGWMLNSEKYKKLYEYLSSRGLKLINNPEEYRFCHEFPNAYKVVKDLTPAIRVYNEGEEIDWTSVKKQFDKFMIKDFVKSVKGTHFPKYFDEKYKKEDLDSYIQEFIKLRGSLFTGGIVIKQFVELYTNNGVTNEYRAFYLNNEILTVSRNSNQSEWLKSVPTELVEKAKNLKSHFYTVDFAQLANGDWVIIETGDGQVSGLSPHQDVFKYYDELRSRLTK